MFLAHSVVLKLMTYTLAGTAAFFETEGPAGFVGLCDVRGRSCWRRNVGVGNPDALGRADAVPHPDRGRPVRARRQGIETALALKTIMPAMSMVAALSAARSDEIRNADRKHSN
jgi:hypothetical protein